VAVGGEEVYVHIGDVYGEDAEGLDGIDAEENVVFGAELADAGEVVALAAGEFDVREGHETRARLGGGGENFFDGDVPGVFGAGLFLDHDKFNPPAAGDFHPGVDVGGVFDIGGDDAVAVLPVDAIGDDADSFAGVFDEGDFVTAGIEHGGGGKAEFFDVGVPGGLEIGTGLGFGGVLAHGIAGHFGQGCDAGMVEEIPIPQHGKRFGISDV